MTPALSPNTQAILLLTAPLIAGKGQVASELLSPGEYKKLARHLREIQKQPSDLIAEKSEALLRSCQPVLDMNRLQRLLDRGFLLGQALERWQARSIWVVSRADSAYPKRLKARLKEEAPPILYGCGDINQIDLGGLSVVGSRSVTEELIDLQEANVARDRMRRRRIARTDVLAQAQAKWQIPVSGVWGQEDALYRGALQQITQRLPNMATPIFIEDAGHWVMYERPEAFHAVADAWLEPLQKKH